MTSKTFWILEENNNGIKYEPSSSSSKENNNRKNKIMKDKMFDELKKTVNMFSHRVLRCSGLRTELTNNLHNQNNNTISMKVFINNCLLSLIKLDSHLMNGKAIDGCDCENKMMNNNQQQNESHKNDQIGFLYELPLILSKALSSSSSSPSSLVSNNTSYFKIIENLIHFFILVFYKGNEYGQCLFDQWQVRSSSSSSSSSSSLSPSSNKKHNMIPIRFEIGDLVRVTDDENTVLKEQKDIKNNHNNDDDDGQVEENIKYNCGKLLIIQGIKRIDNHAVVVTTMHTSPTSSSSFHSSNMTSLSSTCCNEIAYPLNNPNVPTIAWKSNLLSIVAKKKDMKMFETRLITNKSNGDGSFQGINSDDKMVALTSYDNDGALSCLLHCAPQYFNSASSSPAWLLQDSICRRHLVRLFTLCDSRRFDTSRNTSYHYIMNRYVILLCGIIYASSSTSSIKNITDDDDDFVVNDDESKMEISENKLQETKENNNKEEEEESEKVKIPHEIEMLLKRYGIRYVLNHVDRSLLYSSTTSLIDQLLSHIGKSFNENDKNSTSSPLYNLISKLNQSSSLPSLPSSLLLSSSSSSNKGQPLKDKEDDDCILELSRMLLEDDGLTDYEFKHYGLCEALTTWLRHANSLQQKRFLQIFLMKSNQSSTSLSTSSSENKDENNNHHHQNKDGSETLLESVIHHLQHMISNNTKLPIYQHRNPNDIVETTSKPIELKISFPIKQFVDSQKKKLIIIIILIF
jgi:hypothetical protein